MTVLSYSYGIRMDRAINGTGHGFFLNGLNATYKRYLKNR